MVVVVVGVVMMIIKMIIALQPLLHQQTVTLFKVLAPSAALARERELLHGWGPQGCLDIIPRVKLQLQQQQRQDATRKGSASCQVMQRVSGR